MSTPKGATMATCEGCGKMDFISKFRRSKRFCSTACSKKYIINSANICLCSLILNVFVYFWNRATINASPAVGPVLPNQQQQETVSTTTCVNGQGVKPAAGIGGGGLLTTATSTTHSPAAASTTVEANNKLAPPTAVTIPQGTTPPTSFAPTGDKEDSSLDAELCALAAQQLRSPTASLSQTPTQQLKPETKTNPAKWSVSYLSLKDQDLLIINT
jgi:hypothetical protein